jgi:hypothetical protein
MNATIASISKANSATVAPRLWHASRRSDFRIWQEMTVQDIVTEVLDKNGIPHEWRLKQPLKNWVYLVQYNETDLAFICRRLEHEGIYFWFEHAAGGETLVLADHFTSHPNCPGNPSIPFYASPDARAQRDHFDTWRLTREVETGRYQHTDYDFERPKTDLTTTFTDPLGHTYDQYERFHYPGNYIVQGDGSTEALAVQWPQVHIVRGGHAACAQALLAAQAWMTAQAKPALVLAIDSAWPADTLAWLEAQDLLHGAHRPYRGQARANPYGRIPAEGAAALLLAPPGMAPAWCTLAGLGLADEPLTFNTDGPCVGSGLTAAVHAALAAAEERSSPLGRHAITSLIHDANGEPYRADEFGFTALRLADHLAEGWQRLTPVLASGDLICASLATHLAIAAWRLRPRAFPVPPVTAASPTLVLASSDDPARAAVLLTAPEFP